MNRAILIVTLFFLFLLEGTLFQVFTPARWDSVFSILPHLALTVIVMVSLYMGSREGIWHGFAFGLLHDIVYGDVIGLYAFSMAFVAYFAGQMNRIFNRNLILVLITIILSDILFMSLLYGFSYLFGFVSSPYRWVFIFNFLPSIIFNTAFAILVYQPIKGLLLRMTFKTEEQD